MNIAAPAEPGAAARLASTICIAASTPRPPRRGSPARIRSFHRSACDRLAASGGTAFADRCERVHAGRGRVDSGPRAGAYPPPRSAGQSAAGCPGNAAVPSPRGATDLARRPPRARSLLRCTGPGCQRRRTPQLSSRPVATGGVAKHGLGARRQRRRSARARATDRRVQRVQANVQRCAWRCR